MREGRVMTLEQARKIVGRQADVFLQNMAVALSLMTWRNTDDDWQRLEAAVVVLGRKCPRRARQALKARRAA